MIPLADEDITRFDNDGFLVVDRLLDPERIPRLHRAFDDPFHGRFETGQHPDEVIWSDDGYRNDPYRRLLWW